MRLISFAVDPLVREAEGTAVEHVFRCAAASVSYFAHGKVMDRSYEVFSRIDEFWTWFRSVLLHDRTTWSAAYQLGYSLTLLDFWDGLNRQGARWLWGVLEDPPSIAEVCFGRRKVRFVDLTNFWRVPLTELLGAAGLRELGNPEPNPPLPDALDRCRRKVKIIEECLCTTIETLTRERMGSLRCTAASTAWGIWRTSYMNCPLFVHANQAALELDRSALFGGQLSLWRPGAVPERTVALDVNSLYPWVMATQQLPTKLLSHRRHVTVADLKSLLTYPFCVARVAVDPAFLLPQRQTNGKVVYRDEPGNYVLCGETLRLHAAAGRVRHVHELSGYAAGNLLGDFAHGLYLSKVGAARAGNQPARLLYKMLLNGLAGKFAQKRRYWQDDRGLLCPARWGYWTQCKLDGGPPVRCRAVAGQGQRLEEGGETAESCPSVAAAICAAGRQRVAVLVEAAWQENVWYVDTDCLHTNPVGESWLRANGELDEFSLGKLKVVARGQDAYYWSPKFYRVGNYFVSNVLQATAEEISNGLYVQESRCGLSRVLTGLELNVVKVERREVQVRTGPGAYRPTLSKRSTENGQTKKGDPLC